MNTPPQPTSPTLSSRIFQGLHTLGVNVLVALRHDHIMLECAGVTEVRGLHVEPMEKKISLQ